MLKIRLQRTGRINSPSYRVIVTEHTNGPKTGNFVEIVGTYDPKSKARKLDGERIKYWISVGAQPSATIHNMLISEGITKGKKINVLPTIAPAPVVEEKPVAAAPEAVAEEPTPKTEEVAEAVAATETE
jgi:small subunit ribosomal protein S16